MARKTDKQLLLEAMNPGKDIREVLVVDHGHPGQPLLSEVFVA